MLLLAVALIAPPAPASDDDKEVAPNFHAKTMDGQNFTNASVKGKVVLLEFWTTWCPICRSEERMLDSIDKEFAPKGLVLLAILRLGDDASDASGEVLVRQQSLDPGTIEWIRIDAGGDPDKTLAAARRAMMH